MNVISYGKSLVSALHSLWKLRGRNDLNQNVWKGYVYTVFIYHPT